MKLMTSCTLLYVLWLATLKSLSCSAPWLTQISRLELLSRGCQAYYDGIERRSEPLESLDLSHILVDHKHRLLYCYVPKVACTNWKRVLMVLSGTWRSFVNAANNSLPSTAINTDSLAIIPGWAAHADNSTTRLSQIRSSALRNHCLTNYTAFIMVRHPFERLLSAYRNKLESTWSSYFRDRYDKLILKKFRKTTNALFTQNAVVPLDDVNRINKTRNTNRVLFREFVQYVLSTGTDSQLAATMNEHWRPVERLCQPCSINYTFIGHYESLHDDANALLELIGAPHWLQFPSTKVSHTEQKLKYYYQQLSLSEIQQLHNMYRLDFRLFGYSLEQFLGYDLG